ncbi:MAG: DNA/RNA nuclease SfsA [Proteobacteria bacterium]|nr:DNA/RNA nuclease SfsA [Pseudomonadota bacterium]
MRFPDPLIAGTLIRRYKRFLADVELTGGETVTAHCANSGSMLSVNEPGAEVWLSPARNPERKLRYTWEMIRVGGALVGINTSLPNGLVADAIGDGSIPELGGYATLRREVKYGRNSRIDLLLEGGDRQPCYVEVKNVTMRRDLSPGAPAEFPDAVTARGTKHLGELSREAAGGARAVMVYLVQRHDADSFAIARDIDPAYGDALDAALDAGVETLCYGCRLSVDGIAVTGPLAFDG